MRRPSNRVPRFIATVVVTTLALACSRDQRGFSQVVLRAPLGSTTSTVVLARVSATQDGEVTTADIGGDDDSATLSLRVGIPATITGTVFTFATSRWRAFSSSQIVTPEVGTTQVDLTLSQAPGVSGTLVPTVTVRGVPQGVLGEILPITLEDVDTGFTSVTPFTTDVAIEIPAGRSVVFTVPDRFSGGTADLPLATSSFRIDTPLPLALDATIDLGGLDVDALGQSFPALEANGLGLECAVDGGCSATTFAACTADGIKLATERAYTVAVRYAQVPASCEETRVARDLTPPSFSGTTDPPFVQPGLGSITMLVDANEDIAANSVFVTVGNETTNRCTATQLSGARVSCAVDLAGLDLANDVFFGVDVADLAGQHSLRVIKVRPRDAQPVQVVGIRTLPEQPSVYTYNLLVGITVAAFDGQPLCGIGSQVVSFTNPANAAASFGGTGSELWRGPNPAPAKAAGTPNIATYWTSISAGSAVAGDYAVTANVDVLACGARGATPAVLDADLKFTDIPPRWLTPGPLVVSPLAHASWDDDLPIVELGSDDLTSSDFSILQVYASDGIGMSAFKTGRVRVSSVPATERTTAGAVPASIDFEVVGSPELVAVQDGRLVRRGRATDSVTVLPSSLGNTFRVFWESEREITAVLGTNGVWMQARDGSTQTVLNPCGAQIVHSGALTATVPRHPAVSPNLAVIVADDAIPARHTHCEIDLSTGAVVADIPLDNAACADPYVLASDTMTGRLLAAGSGCAYLYRVASPSALTLGADVFFDGGEPPSSMVLDSRSATALVLAAGSVYTISLTDDVLDAFPWSMQRPVSGSFFATAIAIEPVTGVPWVAGRDSSANAAVYLAYPERNSTQVAWIEAQRTDPTAQVAPNVLLFDPGSRSLYSSRPKGSPNATASMLTIDLRDLVHNTAIENVDYPIRAWPDTLDVADMAMVGPQPIGLSVSSAAPGQRVTVIGSGFNGGGRDEVFVQGVPAQVLASTRESITFVMPPAFRALADTHRYQYAFQVAVRSSGLLSGPVSMRGDGETFGEFDVDELELVSLMPGQYLEVPSAPATNCPATCSGGAVLVDGLGRAGVLAVRTTDPNFGVSRLQGNTASELVSSRGFTLPTRIPGMRRIVGAIGASLVEQFAPPYAYAGPAQPYAPQREHATPAGFGVLAPSPNGELIVGSTTAGLTTFNAGDLRPHSAGSLGGVSGGRLAVTSSGLVISANAGGTVAAARLTDSSFVAVPVTTDMSACPSASRGAVLAVAGEALGADVVLVSDFGGGVLAVEEVLDGGAAVTTRCRSFGAAPTPVTYALLDLSGARLVVVAGSLAVLYDTFDMRLPMDSEALPQAPASGILRERGGDLFHTTALQFFTQAVETQ